MPFFFVALRVDRGKNGPNLKVTVPNLKALGLKKN